MKMNVAVWDQAFRLLVGTILVAWGIAGGPWWSFFALYFLVTGSFRVCPVYSTLRTGTKN